MSIDGDDEYPANGTVSLTVTETCGQEIGTPTYTWSETGGSGSSFSRSASLFGFGKHTVSVDVTIASQWYSETQSASFDFTVVETKNLSISTGSSTPISPGDTCDVSVDVSPAGHSVNWTIETYSPDTKQSADAIQEFNNITIAGSGASATITVPSGSGNGTITIRATEEHLSGYYVDKNIQIQCQQCSGSSCQAGSSGSQNGCVYTWFMLGKSVEGQAGLLEIRAQEPSLAMAQPAGLKAAAVARDVEVIVQPILGINAIRQVLAPECLADIVATNELGYNLNFYRRTDVSGKDTNGLYQINAGATPFASYRIENPSGTINDISRLRIAKGETTTAEYSYHVADGEAEWALSTGNGLRIETVGTVTNADGYALTKTVKESDGAVVSRKRLVFRNFDFGARLVEEISDPDVPALSLLDVSALSLPDGAALSERSDYWQAPVEGQYGKLRQVVKSDGSWERYDYNEEGRVIEKVASWLNAPTNAPANAARVMRYDYQPFYYTLTTNEVVTNEVVNGVTNTITNLVVVTTGDDGSADPDKARLETEEIMGEIVAKTWRAIYTNAEAGKVEIEEQCLNPDAAFGDASNLRAVKVYYPPSAGANAPESGRVKTITRPDGRMESYFYERGDYTNGIFTAGSGDYERVTITQGTVASSDGIAGKTTASRTVNDPLARSVLDETLVYTGAGYERIAWTTYAYDAFSRLIRAEKSDGTFSETTWGCCGKESEKDENGIEYVYTYDALQRPTLKMKQGVPEGEYPAQADQYTLYSYDAENRVTTERITAPGLSQSRTNQYDMVGRLTNSTDFAGLATRTAYNPDGLTATETLPGGFTRITERFKDGQTKSITGAAQISQHYEYGVNADGTKWTEVFTGPNGTNSPVWVKTTTDLLSRAIREEKPSYSGTGVSSVILTTTYSYNSKGYLRSSASIGGSTSLTTLYEYDDLGNQIRSGLDLNANGQLDLAGTDRVTESETSYVFDGADWFLQTVSRLYATDNSSTPTTNSITREKLTGLGGGTRSVASVLDVLGNETITTTTVAPSAKTFTQTTAYPDSTNPAVSVTINGLLVSSTSKTGVKTLFTYDSLGRLTRFETGGGTRSVASISHYDSRGWIAYTEDAASNRTTFIYDSATGRKVSQTDPLTNMTFYAWSPESLPLATWGTAVYPVLYEYDDFNRMSAMYTYRGTNPISSYFDICNLKFEMDRTAWQYDLATGLLTNKLYADGKGVSYTYTPDGKLASRAWSRTAPAPLLGGVGGGLLTTLYSYSTAGDLIAIDYSDTTPDIAFTYDRLGRQVTVSQSGTGVPPVIHSFTYSPSTLLLTNEARVAQAFLPVSNVISRDYDSLGRSVALALRANSEAGENYRATYGYSEVGRLNSISPSVQSLSSVVNYSYLPGSDLISEISNLPSEIHTTKSYESNRDLLTQIKNEFDSTIISQYDYANDAGWRRMSVRYSGTAFDDGASFNLYGYNTRSEVIAADRYWGNDMNDTNNPVLAQGFGYEYDPIGNRVSANGGTRSVASAYTANNLNQYTEHTVPGKFSMLGSASEDAYVTVSLTNGVPSPVDRQGKYWHKALEVDNTAAAVYPEIKVVGVYNPQSAGMPDVVTEEIGRKFIAKTPEQFTYDADGNMLSDGRFTYTWDAENRLIAVETESRSGVPAAFMKKLVFAYDYMSRRVSKKLYRRQGNDWASAPQKEIAYIYDGWNLICESVRETKSAGGGGGQGGGGKGKGQGQGGSGGGGGGSVSISTNYYVWGLDLSGSLQGAGGIGGLLCVSKSGTGVSPVSFFSLADGNGNVTDYMDTNGAVVAHREYDPFGGTIALTGSKKDDFTFWFSTKYWDKETGKGYWGYRYYDPITGRWLSRDPMGERGGENIYAFSYNDPIGRIDRLGFDSLVCNFKYDRPSWLHGTVESYPGGIPVCYAANEQNPLPGVPPFTACCGVTISLTPEGETCSANAFVWGTIEPDAGPFWVNSLNLSMHALGHLEIDKDKSCCSSGKYRVTWLYKARVSLTSDPRDGGFAAATAGLYGGSATKSSSYAFGSGSEDTTATSFPVHAKGSAYGFGAEQTVTAFAYVSLSCAP